MPPSKDTPSVLAAGFELIKQYPGEEQVRLKVVVEIPGSWFGSGAAGSLNAGERAEKYQAQAVDFETAHVFGSGKSKKVEAMHLPHLAPWCNTAAVHLHLGAS